MKLKKITLFMAIGMSSQVVTAASPAAIYDYAVGGGNPIVGSASEVGISGDAGVAWDNALSCDDFSLDNSLKAGFDTGQIKRMQTQVIGHLKSVFNPIGLVGTSIRRADPGLYETIMNGSADIKADFSKGLASCEQAQGAILDKVMGGDNRAIAESNRWQMHAKQANVGSFDIITESDMSGLGDEGIQVGGEMKGGVGQAPIKTVADTSKFGFNALTGRDLSDTGTLAGGSGGGFGGGIEQVFSSPQEVQQFLVKTVGESSMRTCEGCAPVTSTPGQGAKVVLDKEREEVMQNLNSVMAKHVRDLTITDLNSVSAGNSVRVTKDVVESLKKMPGSVRQGYIENLATDIATARTVDKLLYARQTLVAGRQESSLAANPSVQDDVQMKITMIDDELNTIEREIRIKRHMAKNTATAILQREAAVNTPVVIDSTEIM